MTETAHCAEHRIQPILRRGRKEAIKGSIGVNVPVLLECGCEKHIVTTHERAGRMPT